MNRDIMQDIRPKRSLREILPKGENRPPKESPAFIPPPPEKPMLTRRNNLNNTMKWIIWAVVALVLVFLFFFVSGKFASVTVKITPNQGKIAVSGTYAAYRNPEAGELSFRTLSAELTESKVVTATGSETVNEKASGQIVVYNDFDSKPQRLIPETRFETKDGKIYRIKEAITVPGQKKVGDKTTPGQIEATVYADKPGTDYNIGLTDFTIPGLKGEPQFEKIYARSKTPMSGGFSGEVKKVDAAIEKETRDSLKLSLSQKLFEEVKKQVPEGFAMFDDAVFVSFSELPTTPSPENKDSAEIKEKATASFVVFDKKELSKYLAENNSVSLDKIDEVLIEEINKFNFKLIDKDSVNIQTDESFSFSVEGSGLIVWQFDEEKMKEDLTQASKGGYQEILAKYGAIERAEVSFKPPWVRKFPKNTEKIRIEKILEQ